MTKLPVVVGFGGINAAGRSSGFHSYKRMVADALSETQMRSTWSDLAHRMGLISLGDITPSIIDAIKQGTLIRRIQSFDPDHVLCHHKALLEPGNPSTSLIMKQSKPADVVI